MPQRCSPSYDEDDEYDDVGWWIIIDALDDANTDDYDDTGLDNTCMVSLD